MDESSREKALGFVYTQSPESSPSKPNEISFIT